MADTTVRFAALRGESVICEYDVNLANGRVSKARVINNSSRGLRAIVSNNGSVMFARDAPAFATSEWPIAGMTVTQEEINPDFPDDPVGIDLGPYTLNIIYPAP